MPFLPTPESGAREVSMRDNTVRIENKEEIVVNLFELARGVCKDFWRNALKILLAAVLVGTVCFARTRMNRTAFYTASASFMINKASGVQYKTGHEQYNSVNRVAVEFTEGLRSSALKSLIMDDLGYSRSENFDPVISVSRGDGNNEMTLRVRSSNPQLAYDTLQAALRLHPAVTEPVVGKVELTVFSDSGVPTYAAVSSSGTKEGAGGAILVLVVAAIWFAARRILNRAVHSGEKLADILGTDLLGSLPYVKSARGKQPAAIDSENCPPAMAEAVRKIRLRLEKTAGGRGVKTILVTSTLSSEGKTTAAANLAISLAAHQQKVLLVEGNLRNPSVLAALSMPQADKGMADILSGSCEADKAMIPYSGDANLTVISGGALGGSGSQSGAGAQGGQPSALWSSPVADRLFGEWRERFDYIIIDSSAAASFAESGLIARLADGCVYVGQADLVLARDVLRGAEAVTSAGCEIIGCVFNADH